MRLLYSLCDEPGCELEEGHESLHFRFEADGCSEWGDYPDLAELVAHVMNSPWKPRGRPPSEEAAKEGK